MMRIIKTAIFFFLLMFAWESSAQESLKNYLVGQWDVKGIYDLGAQIPEDTKKEIKFVQDAFLKSKFQFKKDSSFSLETSIQGMAIKKGHWKILEYNNEIVIQEWKDKDKSSPVLMGIKVLIKEGKTIFLIEELFFAFEMVKVRQ